MNNKKTFTFKSTFSDRERASIWQRLTPILIIVIILFYGGTPSLQAMEKQEEWTNYSSFFHNSCHPGASNPSSQVKLETSREDQLPAVFQGKAQAATAQIQTIWLQKVHQVASFEEFMVLKKHCLNMLARSNQPLKIEKRWHTRLRQLEEFAQNPPNFETIEAEQRNKKSLCLPNEEDYTLLSQTSPSLTAKTLLGKPNSPKSKGRKKLNSPDKSKLNSKNKNIGREEWPENFEDFSFPELELFKVRCMNMLDYEDLFLTTRIWKERLQEIEMLLDGRESRLNFPRILKLTSARPCSHDGYIVRRIYINTKNPHLLDLHGVASAQLAQIKVTQFINAAKSKCKSHVHIITGKGNHKNHRKRQGVLFKAFPGWIKSNKSVTGYTVGKGGGSYSVTLSPSTKLQKVIPYKNFNQLRHLELQIAWQMKHGKSSLPYKQMYKELIHMRYKTQLLEQSQAVYDELNSFVFLPESAGEVSKEGIVEFEETESNSSSLHKARLENFLTDKQKIKLGL
ncbi:Smr/MutS family protein [Candidatus Odyssella acanthamoebae]|uniref:Smr domain-containing protein n=1 Tax=Candidatus Odyssella acanthamoebae TaxID=91604 RepID=A0A077AVZ0_9PROT|nr:Smr/MutS family protein [Candidatus Paracaedibacter acanthamoebae]AIK96566.1 hypothetical protein ID47_07245 [Candidatus Paracaedibacter acanthamoebae]